MPDGRLCGHHGGFVMGKNFARMVDLRFQHG
jgi:hypothetical protein